MPSREPLQGPHEAGCHPPTRATCAVDVQWAGAPGQRVLEGVEQVPQHPREDRVVVQADQEGDGEAAQPCGRRRSAPPPAPAARLQTWHPTLLPVPPRPPAPLVAHSWLRAHRGNMSAPRLCGSIHSWAGVCLFMGFPAGLAHSAAAPVRCVSQAPSLCPGLAGHSQAPRACPLPTPPPRTHMLLHGAGSAASPSCALSSPHQHPAPPGALGEPKRASWKRCAESMSRLSSHGNAATCTSPPC